MGTRGPQRTPAAIAKLKGTYRADRHGKDVRGLTFMSEIPEPPQTLNDEGAKEWYRVTALAVGVSNYLAWNDLTAFEQHCINYQLMREALQELNSNGMVKDGKVSPYFKVYNELLKNYNRSTQDFGLNPSARTRVNVEKPEEVEEQEYVL